MPEEIVQAPPEYCEFCGADQLCSRRACLEALLAQADYAEGQIENSDWSRK